MTIQPGTVNFNLFQGADFSEPATIRDAAQNPINLTGATAQLDAKRDISDASPVFSLLSTTGGIILGGTAGTVTLKIAGALTKAFTVDPDGEVWLHDLLLTLADGSIQRTYQGYISVSPAITKTS